MRKETKYTVPGSAGAVVEYDLIGGSSTQRYPHGLPNQTAHNGTTRARCEEIKHRLNTGATHHSPFAFIIGGAWCWTAIVSNWALSEVDDELRETRLATVLEF